VGKSLPSLDHSDEKSESPLPPKGDTYHGRFLTSYFKSKITNYSNQKMDMDTCPPSLEGDNPDYGYVNDQ
jgi:hypothetical protein